MKSNNKGFTLVELLAVIVVLLVVALVAFPSLISSINSSNNDDYNSVVNNIIMAAQSLNSNYDGTIKQVPLSQLNELGYITGKQINPVNNQVMNGCVEITNGEYTYEERNCEFIYIQFEDNPNSLTKKVLANYPLLKVGSSGCIISDETNYSYMGGCYIKGETSQNYIWYNGMLWRIMGINNDKSIRLISSGGVTALSFAENSIFSDGIVDRWLTNYFVPKFDSTSEIIDEQFCYSGETSSLISARTDCSTGTLISRKAGLISADEYLASKSSSGSTYLNLNQWFWTMSPYSSSTVWHVNTSGKLEGNEVCYRDSIRPIINISGKAIIENGTGALVASGAENSPFFVQSNKSNWGRIKSVVSIGSYVEINGNIFRVILTDDTDNDNNVRLVLDGLLSSSVTQSNLYSTITADTFAQSLVGTNYEQLLYKGTFYKGSDMSSSAYFDYSKTLETTENPYTSYVGLLRYGDIFATQTFTALTKKGTSSPDDDNVKLYWISTFYNNTPFSINTGGGLDVSPSSFSAFVKPVVIADKYDYIIRGTGTYDDPYYLTD